MGWVKTLIEVLGVLAVVTTIYLGQRNQADNAKDMGTALSEMSHMAAAVENQSVATQNLASITNRIATSSDRTSVEATKQTSILRGEAATQDKVFAATFAPKVAVAITGVNALEVGEAAITLSVPAQIQNTGNSPARLVTSAIALFPLETTGIAELRSHALRACKDADTETIWQNELSQSDGIKSANYQATIPQDDIHVRGLKGYKPTAIIGLYVVMCSTYTSDALKGQRLGTWVAYQVREKGSVFIQFTPHKLGPDELWIERMEMLQSSNQLMDRF